MGRLVLTRRIYERVLIGIDPPVVVTVIGVRGNCVRLMVEADDSIAVDRLEVRQAKSLQAGVGTCPDCGGPAPLGEGRCAACLAALEEGRG